MAALPEEAHGEQDVPRRAQGKEHIRADRAGLVGALYHAVRLVIEIGRNGDILGSGGGRRADLSSPNCPVLLSPKNCQME